MLTRFSRLFSLVFVVFIASVLIFWMPRHSDAVQKDGAVRSVAASQNGLGDFETYQQAFAESLKQQGTKNTRTEPSGPVWLQPEVLPVKEACTSCHLGIGDKRFLYARLPYRRHSGHTLEDHAVQRFGCTVCHGGVADGLTFAAAGHPPPEDAARRRQWEQYYGWRPVGKAGMVPLKWIAGRCALCHTGSRTPRGAEPYSLARLKVADKQCTACHRFRDNPVKHVRRAVHLNHLGSKVTNSWLQGYLKAPHAFRPGAAMPDYSYQGEDVQALATYLLSLKDPRISWRNKELPNDTAAVERGLKVVGSRRCQTCHDIPGREDRGFIQQHKVGPSLARVGEKLNPVWIRSWLLDPHAVRPEAAMPRFRFKKGEIKDVVAFLSSLRAEGPAVKSPVASPPPNLEHAIRLATKYGCAACHTIGNLTLDPPPRTDLTRVGPAVLARLAERGATGVEPLEGPRGELEGPRGVFHRSANSPHLFAAGEAVDPVLTFLAGQADLTIPTAFHKSAPEPSPTFEPVGPAGKLIKDVRCLTCHTIRGAGGDIGPDLTRAGSKLKPDWLIRFLQSPQPIRPMNRARMPQLGLTQTEAKTLADWIVSELKAPTVDQTKLDLDFAFSFVGAAKVKTPYGCITCHKIGEEGGRVGPELTHVGSRLNTKWIYHWIHNPQHWIPDVRMPKFEINEEDRLAIVRYLSEQK